MKLYGSKPKRHKHDFSLYLGGGPSGPYRYGCTFKGCPETKTTGG